MLTVVKASTFVLLCQYAESHFVECRYASDTVMLSAAMLNVVMLSVITSNAIMPTAKGCYAVC
jgi:hypothetical protein